SAWSRCNPDKSSNSLSASNCYSKYQFDVAEKLRSKGRFGLRAQSFLLSPPPCNPKHHEKELVTPISRCQHSPRHHLMSNLVPIRNIGEIALGLRVANSSKNRCDAAVRPAPVKQ
ncbi:MAG TPA: hypothetical protein VKS98_10150, partial [Chthoniobacterales bacterium]|nr:hypothetical protein [Chthoniobacterales bacterium]